MAVKLKAKIYGPIRVAALSGEPLRYKVGEGVFDSQPPNDAPAEILLSSLGACMAMSLEWCAKQNKVHLESMTVKVTGTKATSMPSRFEFIEIEFEDVLDDASALSDELIADAKKICTVSNSLSCELRYKLPNNANQS